MGNESLRTNDSVDEILDTYGRMVYRLAYARTKNRYDADDVMQEVFLRYIPVSYTHLGEYAGKAGFTVIPGQNVAVGIQGKL